jgi:hypothetical protein
MTVNWNPGVRPLEAAEIMLLDPSTVTRLVEKLQSKGLVTRKNSGTYPLGIYYGPVRVDERTRKQWLAVSTLAVNRTGKANSRWPVLSGESVPENAQVSTRQSYSRVVGYSSMATIRRRSLRTMWVGKWAVMFGLPVIRPQ